MIKITSTKEVIKRSKSSNNLKNRLEINKKLGSKDLTPWLFDRYKINKNDFILEIGCGRGHHVLIESKIVGKKGKIVATDISSKSLNLIKKKNNIIKKLISMEKLPQYLKKLNMKFDKIISSYAIYYCKNPILLIKKCTPFLKKKGHFFITSPSYPHTLIEFASKTGSLPTEAKRHINFGEKKLKPFLRNYKKKIYNFKNILKFKKKEDLLTFYRSTIFYNKNSEEKILYKFRKSKNIFKMVKSAKLYKFNFN